MKRKLEELVVSDEEVILSYTRQIVDLEAEREKLLKRINWFKNERTKLLQISLVSLR